MHDTIYKKSFDLFLKRTNEKQVIIKFIRENISLKKTTNFLDIGGGSGILALPLSRKVNKTLVIEPNQYFHRRLKQNNIKTINAKWEDVNINNRFDFILAAYVVTYFPRRRRKQLIKKMYDLLRPEGKLLILSIDAKKGSWREVHAHFYKLIGHRYKSSDDVLKEIIQDYKSISQSFVTQVIAKSISEMIDILSFDFFKYQKDFLKFEQRLKKYLEKYQNKSGQVVLEMAHNAHIISKVINI